LGGSPSRRTPKFGQNNCFTYNFLHYEFQPFTSSCTKWPFFGPHIGGSPLTWSLIKTICKQSPIGLYFHQLSGFYIKWSRRISGTSDWSEEKIKNKKKSASIGVSGYDQMKVESLCTSKIANF